MPIRRNQHNSKLGQVLSILPGGGGVAAIPSNLCLQSLFPDSFTGSWICMDSNGTAHGPGSTGWAAVGSPVTQSLRTNLNGPNCGSCTSQRTNGSADAFKTDNIASPTGSCSVEWTGSIDTLPVGLDAFVMKWDASVADRKACYLLVSAAGAVSWVVFKTNASSTAVDTGANFLTLRARHHIVGTYKYVADGTSEMRLYVDGVSVGTPSVTAVGPMQAASSTPWTVGSSNDAGNRFWHLGTTGQAAITEKELSAATIATMSKVCLGNVAGSYGEAITYTRAGTMTLPTPDGGAMTLQPNTIPIIGGGILMEPAGTNIALQSEVLTAGNWSDFQSAGAMTRTDNYATAPDGSKTASRLQIPATIAQFSTIYSTGQVAVAGQVYVVSAWLRATSGSATIELGQVCGSSGNSELDTLVVTDTAWTRYANQVTVQGGDGSISFIIGVGPGAKTRAAQDVLVWGCQLELSPVATSYMRSGASAGTRSAPVCTVANPLVGAGNNPAATNIIKQSQTFGTSWTKNAGADTLTENAVVAPDGTTTADRLTDSVTVTSHQLYQLTTTGVATYTASVYAKAGTASWVAIGDTGFGHLASFNVSTGAVGSVVGAGTTSTITPAGNGFYRVTMTAPLAAATYMSVAMGDSQVNVESGAYAGTGTNVAFWGFQLETGSVATPYIPTTTAAVARAANTPYEWSMGCTVDLVRASTATADANILDIGSYGVANSARLTFNGTSGWPRFDVVDATGIVLSEYSITILPSHFSFVGTMKGPNPYIWLNGRQLAKNDTISGNIMSQPATLYLGCTSLGTNQVGGIISDIKVKNQREK